MVVSGISIVLGYSGVLTVGSLSTLLPIGTAVPLANIYTVGGQIITANPTGFVVDGTTVSPGGSAVTVSGTVISLGLSGALLIGYSSTNVLSTLSADVGPVFTAGGFTFTEASSYVVLDGKTLSPGGSAATVAGTQVSLASDEKLMVGSLTTDLPTSITSGPVFTAGGLVFTEGSSDIVVDGTTLFPGGSPITIASTQVSLGLDGELAVGSTTMTLPTKLSSASSTPQAFEGAQGKNTLPSLILQAGMLAIFVLCV